MGPSRRFRPEEFDVRPETVAPVVALYCGVIVLFQGVLVLVFANSLRLDRTGIGALCMIGVGVGVSARGIHGLQTRTARRRREYTIVDRLLGGVAVVTTGSFVASCSLLL